LLAPVSTASPYRLVPLGLFALAFAVRAAYLFQTQASPLFDSPIMDAAYHDQWARELAAGKWLGDEAFFRAPLYPYFLGSLYRLFGPDYLVARVIQFALGSLSCMLVYYLGRRCIGPTAGVLAGVIAALYGPLIYFDGELLLPVLETFLATLLLLSLVWALEPTAPRLGRWLAAGACLGLFAITRPNILAFVPVVVGAALWRLGLRPGARAGLAFLAATGLCVLPVTLHNALVGRDFVLIASQGGVNFFIGNNPQSDGVTAVVPGTRATWWGGYHDTIALAEQAEGRPLRPSEVSAYWYRQGLGFIGTQPGAWLRLMLRKLLILWNGFEQPNNTLIYAAGWSSSVLRTLVGPLGPIWAPFGLLAPLSLVGGGLALIRRRRALYPGLAFVGLYSLTVIAFFVCDRYRIPLIPALALLAAYAAVEMVQLARRRDVRTLGCVIAGLLACGLMVNYDFYSISRIDAGKGHADLAGAWQQKGRLREAEAEWRLALQLRPDRVEHHLALAACLRVQGRTSEALGVYDDLPRPLADSLDAQLSLGDTLLAMGNDAGALGAYRRAAALSPQSAEAHVGMGECLTRLGRPAEAQGAFRRAQVAGGGGAAPELALAQQAFSEGNMAAAMGACRRALAAEPTSTAARVLLASAQVNTQEFASALANVEQVLRIEPSNAGALTILAVCLNTQGRADAARAAAQTATELRPSSPEAWTALSVSLALLGQHQAGVEAATRALTLDPSDTQARFIRAGCLTRLGQYDRAEEDCRILLQAQPDQPAVHRLLQECKQGRAGQKRR